MALDHRTDPGQVSSASQEASVRTTEPIVINHKTGCSASTRTSRYPANELVQSTDQSWHGLWVLITALIIAGWPRIF